MTGHELLKLLDLTDELKEAGKKCEKENEAMARGINYAATSLERVLRELNEADRTANT